MRERIGRTRGTIVLIGETTWRSNAVIWEIAETQRIPIILTAIERQWRDRPGRD